MSDIKTISNYLCHCRQLICKGRWSEIEISEDKMWNRGLLDIIVKETSPFTFEACNLCYKLFPNWVDNLHGLPFNYSTLEYLVKNHILCINDNMFHALISIVLERDDWKEMADLLFANGANPNIQKPVSGMSLLKSFILRTTNFIDYINSSRILKILSYLLEKDADPLLEDKKGISSLEILKMLLIYKENNRDESLRLFYVQILSLLQYYS